MDPEVRESPDDVAVDEQRVAQKSLGGFEGEHVVKQSDAKVLKEPGVSLGMAGNLVVAHPIGGVPLESALVVRVAAQRRLVSENREVLDLELLEVCNRHVVTPSRW